MANGLEIVRLLDRGRLKNPHGTALGPLEPWPDDDFHVIAHPSQNPKQLVERTRRTTSWEEGGQFRRCHLQEHGGFVRSQPAMLNEPVNSGHHLGLRQLHVRLVKPQARQDVACTLWQARTVDVESYSSQAKNREQ